QRGEDDEQDVPDVLSLGHLAHVASNAKKVKCRLAKVGEAAQHASGAGCPPRKLVVEIFRELGQRRTRLRIESTRSHQSFNFVDEAESASHGPLESGNSIGGGDGTSDGDDRSVLAGAAIICKAIRL